ncbi:Os12g0232700 [Oryza sativa Japonica Group]|uniref:Os12g0232700 protein n=2 Tax=Oryza sativa subsp. japonica TaxID=39947 RepID=Q0IPA0_ORYSJ|nr:hypothetical protein EE612_058551 [Oryza sativa]BAF29465.1 Os12g0232700 [Oryza sativa Japonica Group]BAT16447.1 Os12g0232700 [Oryza sativa Japonica Group]|eukprot:NP_001066446.1 Os12g0232700 [Oryza sativa Japonica Group]
MPRNPNRLDAGDSKSAMAVFVGSHKNRTRKMQGFHFCNSIYKMQRGFLSSYPPATRSNPRGSRNYIKVETQSLGVRLSFTIQSSNQLYNE